MTEKNFSLPQYSPFEKRLDYFLVHSFWSIPLFLMLIFVIFEITFSFGNYLAGFFDIFFSALLAYIPFENVFFHAVYGGVSGVFVYLPNVILLYVFLFLLQDSGLLSRISYVFDRHLKKIGLSGNSFLSLFLGFGCTIPAVLSTKTIENRHERILSVMLLPFITCSAKLPVLVLFVSLYVPQGFQGLFLISLYIVSVLFGVLSHSILSLFVAKRSQSFQIHLPRYKLPELRCLMRQTYFLLKDFLGKVALYILPFSLLLTLLFSFPTQASMQESYGARLGHTLSYVFEPLGMTENMSISILSGLIGKEVVVSSLASLYSIQEEGSDELVTRMQEDPEVDFPGALSFLIFVMLYTPCMGAVATVFRELGKTWGVIFFLYPIVFAWCVSFVVYRVALLF